MASILNMSKPSPKAPQSTGKRKRAENEIVNKNWSVGFPTSVVTSVPYAKALWGMMYTFGDPLGPFTCHCKHPGAKCLCLKKVQFAGELIRGYMKCLVTRLRELAAPKPFGMQELRLTHSQEVAKLRTVINRRQMLASMSGATEEQATAALMRQHEEENKNDTTEGAAGRRAGEYFPNRDAHMMARQDFLFKRTDKLSAEEHQKFLQQHQTMCFLTPKSGKPAQHHFLSWIGAADDTLTSPVTYSLAYIARDRLGCLVETAIMARCGGELKELPADQPLTEDELKNANKLLRPVSTVQQLRALMALTEEQRTEGQSSGNACDFVPVEPPSEFAAKDKERLAKLKAEADALLKAFEG